MTLLDTAERRLASVRPYRPGGASGRATGKLSSNESPLGPSARVRAAVAEAAHEAHRYATSDELRSLLAGHEEVAPEQVVVTNGSDELCYLIATLFIDAGAPVVLSDPSYQIDELVTRVAQGRAVQIPLRPAGDHDLDAMARAAQDAAVLWLPTPHNPTGAAVDPAALARTLAAVPASCLVVLDEAYRPYVDPERRPDALALLAAHPNLLVQRTFSKAHALAGLRVGYGLASPAVAEALQRVRPPFNVNVVALAAARAALADPAWSAYGVELVRRERARLEACLAALGIEHHPSQANFVTLRPADAPALREAFAAAGIAVRDGADLGLPGRLRISIGAPAEMAVVREVLEREAA